MFFDEPEEESTPFNLREQFLKGLKKVFDETLGPWRDEKNE